MGNELDGGLMARVSRVLYPARLQLEAYQLSH